MKNKSSKILVLLLRFHVSTQNKNSGNLINNRLAVLTLYPAFFKDFICFNCSKSLIPQCNR